MRVGFTSSAPWARSTNGYVRLSAVLLRKSAFALLLLLGFGAAGLWIGGKLPTSFVPDEDQGYFYLNVQLPNAASLYRTQDVLAKIQKIRHCTEEYMHLVRQLHTDEILQTVVLQLRAGADW